MNLWKTIPPDVPNPLRQCSQAIQATHHLDHSLLHDLLLEVQDNHIVLRVFPRRRKRRTCPWNFILHPHRILKTLCCFVLPYDRHTILGFLHLLHHLQMTLVLILYRYHNQLRLCIHAQDTEMILYLLLSNSLILLLFPTIRRAFRCSLTMMKIWPTTTLCFRQQRQRPRGCILFLGHLQGNDPRACHHQEMPLPNGEEDLVLCPKLLTTVDSTISQTYRKLFQLL